jgi:hypothetical protein
VGSDPFPEKPDAKPWAQEIQDERVANNFRYHPHNYCLPGGPPITGGAAPFIAKFVHRDDLLVILLEDVGGYRQVFLDGRSHSEWPNPSWLGYSIGHWEGDDLVILDLAPQEELIEYVCENNKWAAPEEATADNE